MRNPKRKQLNMMIVEIDESADFELLSDNLKTALSKADIQWPEKTLTNTRAVNGRRLILILSSESVEVLGGWISNGYPVTIDGEESLIDLGIDWNILASEGETIDQSLILPFVVDDVTFDEEETPTYTPVTDLTGRLQTWAGRNWIYHDTDN